MLLMDEAPRIPLRLNSYEKGSNSLVFHQLKKVGD